MISSKSPIERVRQGGRAFFAVGLVLPALVVLLTLFPTAIRCEPTQTQALRMLDSQDRQAVLDRLGVLQKNIRTFQADFVEERMIPSFNAPLRYEGRLYCEVDNLFFMEYTKPIHHILRIMKNEALIFVDGSRTADVVDISSAEGVAGRSDLFAIDPAGFSGQIREDEDFYILGDFAKSEKEANGPAQKVSVYLDKNTLLARKIHMEDESGDETMITLSKMDINTELPKSVLSYELPEGVRINRLDKP